MIIKKISGATQMPKSNSFQVIIDCLGVGLLKSKDEIVSMHVTQVNIREINIRYSITVLRALPIKGLDPCVLSRFGCWNLHNSRLNIFSR